MRKIAITGAFGYTGKYIAKKCLEAGDEVITITNSVDRENSFGDRIRVFPMQFDNANALVESLRGTDILINTYWVRFNHRLFAYQDAVANTKILFGAAEDAGVRKIVHVSITNPDESSDLEYFRGKALLEKALIDSGISYAILRPAVIFGKEDILINNIAWGLRKFPIFGYFGEGEYRIQPIYVGDLAEIAYEAGLQSENNIINCIGPETFTYCELIQAIDKIIGTRRKIISIPPRLGLFIGGYIGRAQKDVLITADEIKGLMRGLLYVEDKPTGKTRLTDWLGEHKDSVGQRYASELRRRIDRTSAYLTT
ncbi:MAG: NAD(P)H-binding protein [Candidatus Zixiibacteriota bacterium]